MSKAGTDVRFTHSSALVPRVAPQFEKIEERGNVGCGYIPDAHMDSILGCTAKIEAGNCNPSADFLIKTGYFQRNAFSEASNHKNSASAVYAESWAIYCQ